MTKEQDNLIELLEHAAIRASDFHRGMAEAKSLRQDGNTERRTDLYMWPTPEQTLEGRAAAELRRLSAENTRLVNAGKELICDKQKLRIENAFLSAECEALREALERCQQALHFIGLTDGLDPSCRRAEEVARTTLQQTNKESEKPQRRFKDALDHDRAHLAPGNYTGSSEGGE